MSNLTDAPLTNPFNPLGLNPGPEVQIYGTIYQTKDLMTDDDYIKSKPLIMQENWAAIKLSAPNLDGSPTEATLKAMAIINSLTAAGILIDNAIDFEGWDPFITMAMRMGVDGLATVPDWTGKGTIKVSILKADYPPAVPPTPPPAPPASVLVGALMPALTQQNGKNCYALGNVAVYLIASNAVSNAPDGTPVKIVKVNGLMGQSAYWIAS